MWRRNRPYPSQANYSQAPAYPFSSPPLKTDYLYQKGGAEDNPAFYLVSPEELAVVNEPILAEQEGGAEAEAETEKLTLDDAVGEDGEPNGSPDLADSLVKESSKIPDKVNMVVLSMGVSENYSQLISGIFITIGVLLFLFLCFGVFKLTRASGTTPFQKSWTGPPASSVSLKKIKPHSGILSARSSARPLDLTKLRKKIFG